MKCMLFTVIATVAYLYAALELKQVHVFLEKKKKAVLSSGCGLEKISSCFYRPKHTFVQHSAQSQLSVGYYAAHRHARWCGRRNLVSSGRPCFPGEEMNKDNIRPFQLCDVLLKRGAAFGWSWVCPHGLKERTTSKSTNGLRSPEVLGKAERPPTWLRTPHQCDRTQPRGRENSIHQRPAQDSAD